MDALQAVPICPICLEPIYEHERKVSHNGVEVHSDCYERRPEELEDTEE
jgi:hypothetical protein